MTRKVYDCIEAFFLFVIFYLLTVVFICMVGIIYGLFPVGDFALPFPLEDFCFGVLFFAVFFSIVFRLFARRFRSRFLL